MQRIHLWGLGGVLTLLVIVLVGYSLLLPSFQGGEEGPATSQRNTGTAQGYQGQGVDSAGVVPYPDRKKSVLWVGFPAEALEVRGDVADALRKLALQEGYLRIGDRERQKADVCSITGTALTTRSRARPGDASERLLTSSGSRTLEGALCVGDLLAAIQGRVPDGSEVPIPPLEGALTTLETLYNACRDAPSLDECVYELNKGSSAQVRYYGIIIRLAKSFIRHEFLGYENLHLSDEQRADIITASESVARAMLRQFLSSAPNAGALKDVYRAFGFIAIVTIPWINSLLDFDVLSDRAANALGVRLFYTDAWDFLLDLAAVHNPASIPLSWDIARTLYELLAIASADNPDIESLHRLQRRVRFARRAHDGGWQVERLNMYVGNGLENTGLDRNDRGLYIDLVVTGRYNDEEVVGYILLDAVKSADDLEALLRRMRNAIQRGLRSAA